MRPTTIVWRTGKIEAHLNAKAQEAPDFGGGQGVGLPDEIKRRENRVAAIAVAKGCVADLCGSNAISCLQSGRGFHRAGH